MLHTVFLPQCIPSRGKTKKKKGLSVISCGLERNPAWKACKSNLILEQLDRPFSVFIAHQLSEDHWCTRTSAFHRWVWQAQIIPFLVELQRKLQLRGKKKTPTQANLFLHLNTPKLTFKQFNKHEVSLSSQLLLIVHTDNVLTTNLF